MLIILIKEVIDINKNRLFFYWKLGKSVFYKQKNYNNVVSIVSTFYSYRYGRSYTYSKNNIINMKLFYLCFPIYYEQMSKLSWEHYLLLIKLVDRNERNFYFKTSMFCLLSVEELNYLINELYYNRI